MITTNKFSLTPKQFFKIRFDATFSKLIWKIYPFFVAIFIILNWPIRELTEQCFVLWFVLLPILVIINLWMHAKNEKNKIFLLERFDEFYGDKMISHVSEGSNSTTMLASLKSYKERRDYYMLYISHENFFYLPKSAFKNKNDHDWFEEVVLMKFKKKG